MIDPALFDEKVFKAAKFLWDASKVVSRVSLFLAVGACAVAILAYGVKTVEGLETED